ncbi:MAG: hypothetical protein JSS76_09855 [Bacteroidetes bacterium]|nr:hypothetical protein [Bacteroidota bacterium]
MKYLLCLVIPFLVVSPLRAQTLTIVPDPFVDTARIHLSIVPADTVSLMVIDVWGSTVKVILPDTLLSNAVNEVLYDTHSLPAGPYIFSLLNGTHRANARGVKTVTTGINSLSDCPEILAHPNPCSNRIELWLPRAGQAQLCTADGRCLWPAAKVYMEPGQYTLDLDGYANGMYYVHVAYDNGAMETLPISKR